MPCLTVEIKEPAQRMAVGKILAGGCGAWMYGWDYSERRQRSPGLESDAVKKKGQCAWTKARLRGAEGAGWGRAGSWPGLLPVVLICEMWLRCIYLEGWDEVGWWLSSSWGRPGAQEVLNRLKLVLPLGRMDSAVESWETRSSLILWLICCKLGSHRSIWIRGWLWLE